MASLSIRNIDEDTKRKLRQRAQSAGHSMEQEVREILVRTVNPPKPQKGFGTMVHEMFKDIGLKDEHIAELPNDDLEIPEIPE